MASSLLLLRLGIEFAEITIYQILHFSICILHFEISIPQDRQGDSSPKTPFLLAS
jgi:hypothetical protein